MKFEVKVVHEGSQGDARRDGGMRLDVNIAEYKPLGSTTIEFHRNEDGVGTLMSSVHTENFHEGVHTC